jgi:hypothetical protein
MASEKLLAKRFLRLAGAWPKDTREPRGPEHVEGSWKLDSRIVGQSIAFAARNWP